MCFNWIWIWSWAETIRINLSNIQFRSVNTRRCFNVVTTRHLDISLLIHRLVFLGKVLALFLCTGIFDLFGFALAFKLNICVIMEDSSYKISFSDDNAKEINALYFPSTGECCSLVKTDVFGQNCSDHNQFCCTNISSNLVMTCKDCKLQYHQFCVGSQYSCGCVELPALVKRSTFWFT